MVKPEEENEEEEKGTRKGGGDEEGEEQKEALVSRFICFCCLGVGMTDYITWDEKMNRETPARKRGMKRGTEKKKKE